MLGILLHLGFGVCHGLVQNKFLHLGGFLIIGFDCFEGVACSLHICDLVFVIVYWL